MNILKGQFAMISATMAVAIGLSMTLADLAVFFRSSLFQFHWVKFDANWNSFRSSHSTSVAVVTVWVLHHFRRRSLFPAQSVLDQGKAA